MTWGSELRSILCRVIAASKECSGKASCMEKPAEAGFIIPRLSGVLGMP
jgi:hypothetical protein